MPYLNPIELLSAQPIQFDAPQRDFLAGQNPEGAVAADLNGDGIPDLVAANAPASGSVSVLLGRGDGTFQPTVSYATSAPAEYVVVRDFNRDGHLDVATSSGSNTSLSILFGNGDGTLQPPQMINAGVFAYSLQTADLNNDGKLDLIWTNGSKTVYTLLGKGDGTFRERRCFVLTIRFPRWTSRIAEFSHLELRSLQRHERLGQR